MNILFIIDRYPGIGGIENVSTIIIKELQTECHISVIALFPQEGVKNPLGWDINYLPRRERVNSGENFSYIEDFIHNNQIDKIIYQDSYGPTYKLVCHVATKCKVPLYVFEHNSPLFIYNKRGLDPITSPKGFLRRVLHPYLLHRELKRKRYLLEHCKKYVLLSKAFIPEFCHLVGTDLKNPQVTYINNPCKSIACPQVVDKENVILCVCQLNKTKQVDKMLELWRKICRDLEEWKFIIVGDGDEMAHLNDIVSQGCIPRVEFVGFANPIPYYQKARIFWMMSKFEGWGMTLVEAMQCGCVPIAWNTYSSLRDIIDDGINGFVVKNEDRIAFGERTMSLAQDVALFDMLSQSAREKSREFELDIIVSKWRVLLGM